jgi:hypothetical protein
MCTAVEWRYFKLVLTAAYADQDWSPKIVTVSCDRYYEDGDARVWREIHSSADRDADLFVHTGDQVCG